MTSEANQHPETDQTAELKLEQLLKFLEENGRPTAASDILRTLKIVRTNVARATTQKEMRYSLLDDAEKLDEVIDFINQLYVIAGMDRQSKQIETVTALGSTGISTEAVRIAPENTK